MKKAYVVLMGEGYIRDAQMFDTSSLSAKEFKNLDESEDDYENLWCDMSPTPYIGCVVAASEKEAVKTMAKESGYDPRMLYAVEIRGVVPVE